MGGKGTIKMIPMFLMHTEKDIQVQFLVADTVGAPETPLLIRSPIGLALYQQAGRYSHSQTVYRLHTSEAGHKTRNTVLASTGRKSRSSGVK